MSMRWALLVCSRVAAARVRTISRARALAPAMSPALAASRTCAWKRRRRARVMKKDGEWLKRG
jgi:hypothetical protein